MKKQNFLNLLIKDKNSELSPELLKTASLNLSPDLSLEQRKAQIIALKHFIDLIIALGWAEHSHDWDPYIIIKTHEEKTYESQPGSYTITFSEDEPFTHTDFQVIIPDDDDEDLTLKLNPKDIQSITLCS